MIHAEGSFLIVNGRGLHARAAAKLARLAERFESEVIAAKDDERVNAKSIMGLLLLCGHPGAALQVIADGPDADQAVREIGELISSGFGEAH